MKQNKNKTTKKTTFVLAAKVMLLLTGFVETSTE